MSVLDRAVRKTVSYANYFHFPLREDEVHHWLISSKRVGRHLIKTSPLSTQENDFRHRATSVSETKLNRVLVLHNFFKFFPTIKLVAVTGSVAVKNAKLGDDIDLMIVTADHTLWITRLLFLIFLPLKYPRRLPSYGYQQSTDLLCPNLWLEIRSLSVEKTKRNLFTAHEVLQATPVFDRDNTYRLFVISNSWVKRYLANAYHSISAPFSSQTSKKVSLSFFLVPLNLVCYWLQYLYMSPKKTVEDIKYSSAFFHQVDFASHLKTHLKNQK